MNSIQHHQTDIFPLTLLRLSKTVPQQNFLLLVVLPVTFVSGLLNLYAALQASWLSRQPAPPDWFPLEFLSLPHLFTLLLGFVLIVLAFNIWKRKRRAFQVVLWLSCLSALLPLWRTQQWGQPGFSLRLIGSLLTILVFGYSFVVFFRPILDRFYIQPQERELASQILQQYGRTAMDNFKLWPDKSFFFNATNDCFIAYRVAANMAVALGDPVGAPSKVEDTLRQFQQFCDEQGWSVALHQTQPIWLSLYRGLGFRQFKLGDDAIVDLTQFLLANKRMKRFRQRVVQLEKHGVRFRHYPAPASDELLAQLREVSDEWLQLPKRRERSFTVGSFIPDYLRTTTIFTAEDADGKVLAFVNLLVSYCAGEVTIDLMRHRWHAPNGIMDYLFVKLFEWSRAQGHTRFNLGMAPMAGFQECEKASAAERLAHAFCQRSSYLFSFSGIKQYKAKFANFWEPRYVIYRNVFDLPHLAIALSSITEASVTEYNFRQSEGTVRNLFTLAQETETELIVALARRESTAS